MLDLAALDRVNSGGEGTPPEMSLAFIAEDPNQPRKNFNQAELNELAESIKRFGVISPIKIRPNPEKPGHYIIVYGARRYRASIIAAKDSIPYILGDTENAKVKLYIQIAENLQRTDLSTLDLAGAIYSLHVDEGESKASIAKGLAKDASYVTHHLALYDAPQFIKDIYLAGQCTSAKTLYGLIKLSEKFPAEVLAWCVSAETIDRGTIAAFAETLRNPVPSSENSNNKPEPEQTVTPTPPLAPVPPQTVTVTTHGNDDDNDEHKPKPHVQRVPFHNLENEEKPPTTSTSPKPNASGQIKTPCLLVEHNNRPAVLLLHQKPTKEATVFIRYEENGLDAEVSAHSVKIMYLIEARKK